MYMFRDKHFPSWESYPTGGCWIVKLNKAVGVTSKLWQDLVRDCAFSREIYVHCRKPVFSSNDPVCARVTPASSHASACQGKVLP
jgi:hypothetical protein